MISVIQLYPESVNANILETYLVSKLYHKVLLDYWQFGMSACLSCIHELNMAAQSRFLSGGILYFQMRR